MSIDLERPILFSSPMVRATLEGRKTQTRRVIKNKQFSQEFHERSLAIGVRKALDEQFQLPCPYGQPRDQLWVRESLRINGVGTCAVYRADGLPVMVSGESTDWRWKRRTLPSIHMPRWASRIDLEVTGVRVERLQEISEEDAKAEAPIYTEEASPDVSASDAVCMFAYLWDSINAKRGYSWKSNPWVWAVEFKRIRPQEEAA